MSAGLIVLIVCWLINALGSRGSTPAPRKDWDHGLEAELGIERPARIDDVY